MKVPHPYVPRTSPSAQPMGYLSAQGASPEAFGAGLARSIEGLGADLNVMVQKATQRKDSNARFGALTGLSDFQSNVNQQLVELKRNADPTGKGYVPAAEQTFDKEAQKYLATLPEELKPEFIARTEEIKKGVIGDSLSFQYQAGDANFRKGVDTEYQRALVGLDPKMGGDPTQLSKYKAHLNEIIDATDLSEIEKADLKLKTAMGMEGVGYKATLTKAIASGAVGGSADVLRKEEGFRATPYWDTNHYRVGFGSDTVTYADGSVHKVKPGMRISREDAERDLKRRVETEFEPAARREVGDAAWNALSGNARAALVSVTYNYGNLPDKVAAAARTGNVDAIANAVAGLGSNKERRQREAALIRGGGEPTTSDIDSNPAFSSLTYEDRVNLQKDAMSEATAASNAQAKAEKDAAAARQNELYMNLADGKAGQADIDAGRQEGWLTDYDAFNKANEVYKKYNEENVTAAAAWTKLGDEGAVWDPTDTKDNKMLNALVGKTGLAGLTGMNADTVAAGIVPIVQRAHDIPTDVVGTLMGMVRSSNQQQAFFALDTLNQLQDADPRAYDARVPDSLASVADAYRTHKDLYPADELMGIINGGKDQQSRRANAVLEKEAKDILSSSKNGVTKVQELVQDVVGSYGTVFSSPALSGVPAYARGLTMDYQTAFTDGYKKFGNESDADDYAKKLLQRSWGVTGVGGNVLMKHPPEKVGYAPIGGDYSWIDRQVRSELQLKPEDRFELVSDDQTEQEFAKWQRQGGEPPSYQVVTFDVSGVGQLQKERRFFQPTEADKAEEVRQYDLRKNRIEMENLTPLLEGAKLREIQTGGQEKVPQEYLDRQKELEDNTKALQPPPPIDTGPDLGPSPATPMGDFGGY